MIILHFLYKIVHAFYTPVDFVGAALLLVLALHCLQGVLVHEVASEHLEIQVALQILLRIEIEITSQFRITALPKFLLYLSFNFHAILVI